MGEGLLIGVYVTPKRLTRKPSSSVDDDSPIATGMKASFHHSFLDYVFQSLPKIVRPDAAGTELHTDG